ncbi:MAG: hypothetical protein ACTHM1_11875 [Solirubrobacteraceae bacterium]
MQPLDWKIIDLILSGAERRPWSARELTAIFGDDEAVQASLRRLYYVELIHGADYSRRQCPNTGGTSSHAAYLR